MDTREKAYEWACKAESVGIKMLGMNRMNWDVGQAAHGYQGKSVWIGIAEKAYTFDYRGGSVWTSIPGKTGFNSDDWVKCMLPLNKKVRDHMIRKWSTATQRFFIFFFMDVFFFIKYYTFWWAVPETAYVAATLILLAVWLEWIAPLPQETYLCLKDVLFVVKGAKSFVPDDVILVNSSVLKKINRSSSSSFQQIYVSLSSI